jgi:Na+-translocating ferredoxin:NAD+ oxidoreductase subunit G
MKETLRLCFVLTLICAVCAAVMSFVDQKTKAPIEKSIAAEKMDAVKAVIPPCDNDLAKSAITIADKDREMELTFYVGTTKGVPVGAAFAIVATGGYAGAIDLLVGADTAGAVTGIEILRHAETPGLGAKITTPLFRKQFIGKSIKDPTNWSVVKDGGPFKQITGATVSSRAVTTAIASGLEFLDAHKAEVFGAAKAACMKPKSTGGK